MKRIVSTVLPAMLCAALSGCILSPSYDGILTNQYATEPEHSRRAVSKGKDKLEFALGDSTIGFISGDLIYPNYGVSLGDDRSLGSNYINPTGAFRYAVHIAPGPRSFLIVQLDQYRIMLDGTDSPIAPTHYRIQSNLDPTCRYSPQEQQLRAYGEGCYFVLYYGGARQKMHRPTLIPAPVFVDDAVYVFPNVMFE